MSTTTLDLKPELKAKHRAMWAFGDYADVADQVVGELGAVLVDASGIQRGDTVLDVAAGSGNATIPAARRGADVVGLDLVPELLDRGRKAAESAGVEIDWQEGDAEALPYADGAFDVVISNLGVMFAPHHQRGADEIVRVTRRGGTIGLLSWTPQGFIGQMFAIMKNYVPPPPAGVSPPPLWGDPDHVQQLLGDRVAGFVSERRMHRVDRFATAEEFRDYFKACYGPTIAAFKSIADQPERVAELDAALLDLARRHDLGGGAMEWEYLLVTCRKVDEVTG